MEKTYTKHEFFIKRRYDNLDAETVEKYVRNTCKQFNKLVDYNRNRTSSMTGKERLELAVKVKALV